MELVPPILATAREDTRREEDVLVSSDTFPPAHPPLPQNETKRTKLIAALTKKTAEKILDKSTITGDRVNGLLDGVAGDWFYRFDTRKPCHENGLPLTLVIARYDLLDILRNAVGPESIMMETVVDKYEHKGDRVTATLADGRTFEGDVLVGADGIRSKMRAQIRGEDPENPPLAYAGYAVYTAICDYSAPHREALHTDVDKTGYQVGRRRERMYAQLPE